MTFKQFLLEAEKRIKLYGLDSGHASKLVSPINPAKPHKPTYSGLAVQQILPVPRIGKTKTGVMGS